MTATNHMLAGAVVAVSIQHPLLIAPVAIVSHFVLDALPHFGVHRDDSAKRNKHPLFQYILAVDIALTIAMMALLPSVMRGAVSGWVLLLGMTFAFLPDVVWVQHFFGGLRNKQLQLSRISRFHGKIQWGERSWGVAIEVVFFGALAVLLGTLAA